jgi:hypothetical protein|uniref:Uncharacterized protein n=1 Tax=Picea glauca TaxID=3330 RepID=A0A101LYV2_PICGL|nr:hypothetical protein ABT39_MTgene4894 [Picea glauca]QHR92341.1 hypothetical protein Q903MT_gene6383 [Picea sitchensis]
MAGSTEATAALGTCASPAPRYAAPGYGTVRAASTDSTDASTTLASVALSILLDEVLALDLHLYLNLRLQALP